MRLQRPYLHCTAYRLGHAFTLPLLMVLGLRKSCFGVSSMPEALDSLEGNLSVQLQPALGMQLLSASFMDTRTISSTNSAQMGSS